jgi:hypothetical protein
MEFFGILEYTLHDRILDDSKPSLTIEEKIKIFYQLLEKVNSLHLEKVFNLYL